MDRRTFLGSIAGAGATVLGWPGLRTAPANQAPGRPRPAPLKHWAWMRGRTSPLDDWRRRLAVLKAGGIDAILISGSADFYRTAVPAAAAEGLELHAWIFTMMRGDHVAAHPEWYAVSRSGPSTAVKPPYVDYYRFMCPSRDDVRASLVKLVDELASIDGLASVHLDYVRYPDVILPIALWPKYNLVQDREYPDFDYCYCDVCRTRFRRQAGVDPRDLADPPASAAWVKYRYDSITEVVELLARTVHARDKAITAAVFPTPDIARRLVRQDWVKWPIDAFLPMVYHGFYKEDVPWIERATREGVAALAGRAPLYSGLYLLDLPPRELADAAARALDGGARGISLFEASMMTPAHWSALTPILRRRRDA
jgi:uncharacterized lipoprotein YddW (UPF0748 family)